MIRSLLATQRVVKLNLTDFAKLVSDKLADKRTQIAAENFTTGEEALNTLQKMAPGSCVMELIEEKQGVAVDPICVTCWRGKEKDAKGSLNLFVTKQVGARLTPSNGKLEELRHMLRHQTATDYICTGLLRPDLPESLLACGCCVEWIDRNSNL